jgi:hypothetical protein
MKVCVISANLGGYDVPHPWVEQSLPEGVELEIHRLTDENFPPRHKAMTSRLQCGIPKMFGWEMFPGADVYLWVDASCALLHPSSVAWFLEQLGNAEIVLFKHPDRRNVWEEFQFIRKKMYEGNKYLCSRYEGELIGNQCEIICSDDTYRDDQLFASTAFAYRPTEDVKNVMWDWWGMKSRYCLHDQLALPYVLRGFGVKVNVINQDYRKCEYLTYVRNKKAAHVVL